MWQVALLVVTVFLWGVSPIIEKTGLGRAGVFAALFIRSGTIFIVLLAVACATGRIKDVAHIPVKSFSLFVLSGLCAGLVGMWTYFTLLKFNPSSKIVPLVATYPLITSLLGILLLREEMSWQRFFGTALIAAGILLVK